MALVMERPVPTPTAFTGISKQKQKSIDLIKKGIWLYFWMLIFEGALRKWFLPFLASPLLIVRDPIAMWVMIMAYNKGLFKINSMISGVWIITSISFLFTMLFGHGNIAVALYGARITFIHFPFIFAVAQIFNKEDVEKMGVALMWTVPIQTLVMGLQFYSPQSAWINKGIGGEEVAGFNGAMGFNRPPGTFSFTNGLASYYGLVGAFVFYFWLDKDVKISKWVLIAATTSLLIAIPLSISRSMLVNVGISAVFSVIIAARKPKILGRLIGAAIGIVLIFSLLGKVSFFQTGLAAFTERFESASDYKDNGATTALTDRLVGSNLDVFTSSTNLPLWGYGLGLGTNAGAKIATGKAGFLIGEGEWGRVTSEMGLLLGTIYLLMRVKLGFSILLKAFKALKFGNLLPWLLTSFCFLFLLEVQWAQPTSLGFAVFSSGLALAAFRARKVKNSTKI